MNKIWLALMMVGVTVLLFIKPDQTLPAMLSAATEGIEVSFSLLAVYTVWLGLFEILDASGLTGQMSKGMRPLIRWLYGDVPPLAQSRIAMNMSANLLGLGGAATPMGIEAAKLLDNGSGTASDSLIMLIVVNATSIQLLPTTIIGIRAASGSVSPADIIVPSLIATAVTTVVGVALCKLCAAASRRAAARKAAKKA